jgi:hypothetical protein
MKGEFLGLFGAYLVARHVPIIKYFTKPIDFLLKKMSGSLWSVMRKAPVGEIAKAEKGVSVFSKLIPFLGRLFVIGGIITAGYIAVTKIQESIKIVKNIVNTLSDMKDIEQKNQSSLNQALQKIKNKKNIEIKELEEKEKEGTISQLESLQLRIKRYERDIAVEQEQMKLTASRKTGFFDTDSKAKKEELTNHQSRVSSLRNAIKEIEKQINNPDTFKTVDDSVSEILKKIEDQRRTSKKDPIKMKDGAITSSGVTVVQPDSKDHHLFAKDGGPFDNFLKEMNANFDEKLSMLVALSNETIGAILQGSGQVSQTIMATSGSKSSDSPKSYGNGDPIRDQRNRANMTISR